MASVASPAPTRQRPSRGNRRWSRAWVTFSSVAVVGQYAQGTLAALGRQHVGLAAAYAEMPWPVQAAFYLHITFAGLALALGPWQFSRGLRARRPAVHRVIGRVYLVGVGLGSVAAFVMSFFNSVALLGFFGFGSLAVVWGWTAWRAYRAVRERDIPSHQAWMIRNFALTYAAVTLRLWLGVLILAQIPFVHGADASAAVFANAYAPLPFLAWLPNLVIAELMIRRRGLPALHLTTDPARRRPVPTH